MAAGEVPGYPSLGCLSGGYWSQWLEGPREYSTTSKGRWNSETFICKSWGWQTIKSVQWRICCDEWLVVCANQWCDAFNCTLLFCTLHTLFHGLATWANRKHTHALAHDFTGPHYTLMYKHTVTHVPSAKRQVLCPSGAEHPCNLSLSFLHLLGGLPWTLWGHWKRAVLDIATSW